MSERQSRLELLPSELLDQVLSYLCTDPPSPARLHRSPSLSITSSEANDLKNASLVSSRLRMLILPLLFAHSCFRLESESAFLAFISRSGLGKYVKSIVVTQSDSANNQSDLFWWRRVLRRLDPLRVTVVAPSPFLCAMLGMHGVDADGWAFEIPLQIMHLEQDRRQRIPGQFELEGQPSIVSCRPWTSLLFNEGSSLRAYNHYEYFHFQVPSLFHRWGLSTFLRLKAPRAPIRDSLQGLTSFHYVAVFPFYNHVTRVLDAVDMLTSLQSLSIQLAPDPSDDIEIEQKASMNASDPWMELATGYSIIAHTIMNQGGGRSLRSFVSRDYDGLRSELSDVVGDPLGSGGWVHDGHGTWTRPAGDSTDRYSVE